jgi:uncharacterized phage protein (TIGR01671 family)
MNREIKFRAWDGKNFIYSENVTGSYWGDIILDGAGPEYVIQQYTGLRDKNGKEIYEGDIVQYKYPCSDYFIGKIYFKDGSFRLHDSYIDDVETELEIIGNIYEHKHLLEAAG